MTSYKHGDQRNGKADEWKAFLKNIGCKSEMVSFLHHRFNILFVLGGATYYHRNHLRDFENRLDGSNFLHQSIKQDIMDPIFLAANRALGIFNKLVTGPLFRLIEGDGSKFYDYLVESGKDASSMLETFFEDNYITKDSIFDALFLISEDPLFDVNSGVFGNCLLYMCCYDSKSTKGSIPWREILFSK